MSEQESLALLDAVEAGELLRRGSISCEDLARACLARIEALEEQVGAWTFLDPEHVLKEARALDDRRRQGRPLGPLFGLPVGIKDIIDTRDMPTGDGSPLHAGRRSLRDATVVSLLREAGALPFGKTVTTEFAVYGPGKTRNPHDPERTPGGSSSGSAAAVAAGMVPLAIGTQTNGSVIRPASFCGVFGFKPTHGLISRQGVLALSRPLDTLGVFARSVTDLALIAEPLLRYDAADPDTRPVAHPELVATVREAPPVLPHLAFVKSPVWEEAVADTQEAFAELVELLDAECDEVDLPETFSGAIRWHSDLMLPDIAKSLTREYEQGRDQLSARLLGMIEEGQRITAVDYNRALDWREVLNRGLEEIFQRFDAILTPAAPGEAPRGLDSTGNPCFSTLWTFCGLPCVSLPLMRGENGLPIGAQLVGPRGGDARLLRTARWLADLVTEAGAEA